MRTLFRRSLAVTAALVLTAAGVAVGTAAAQADVPATASVAFSDQNCDIPTGGTLIPFVDGVDLTITNAADATAAFDYSIVEDFNSNSPYEQGTLQPGTDRHITIPLSEDTDTTVQVFDTSPGGGLIGGTLASVDCTPNSSPQAVATIAPADCAFPTGGIIPPSPGFSFTLDNSAGTGPADYTFTAGDTTVENGVVAAGDTRTRAWSLDEDTPTVATISSVDTDGNPVVLTSSTEEVNCVADTPTITSPTAGQVLTSSPADITGTGTPGDGITVVVGDASTFAAASGSADLQTLAAASTPVLEGDGFTVYATTVGADGTFAVSAPVTNGDYGVAAIASRDASEGGAVPASVSSPSGTVLFSVAIPVVPAGTITPGATTGGSTTNGTGAGTLASTGLDPMLPIGSAIALLLAGAVVMIVRRPIRP
jgi:hypothetical protein